MRSFSSARSLLSRVESSALERWHWLYHSSLTHTYTVYEQAVGCDSFKFAAVLQLPIASTKIAESKFSRVEAVMEAEQLCDTDSGLAIWCGTARLRPLPA